RARRRLARARTGIGIGAADVVVEPGLRRELRVPALAEDLGLRLEEFDGDLRDRDLALVDALAGLGLVVGRERGGIEAVVECPVDALLDGEVADADQTIGD